MLTSRTGMSLSRATFTILATSLLCAAMVGPAPAQVPTPIVTGPIPAVGPPGTDLAHNYPQLASEPTFNLSRAGYIEEEFFFGGTATSYSTPNMADGVVVSMGHPYKSRMIVRRPAKNGPKFNGVVLVEWVNVTSGYNLDVQWGLSHEYLTQQGYAYVGVSAQRVGVQQAPYGLTVWSPTRYGTLDVTDGGTVNNDSLSYDIFSQAGQAIRHPREAGVDVLDGLKLEMLIAVGASQSASRLALYYNSIQPLHRVYDALVPHLGGGPYRTDVGTKLLRVNSEREIDFGAASQRQPDSDIFRSWEVAATSHVGYQYQMFRGQFVGRDGLAPFNFTCDRPPLSHVLIHPVLNAAYAAMVDWVKKDKAPPVATPILVTSTSPLVIPRDANGHVFGGIRLADLEVPLATNTGTNSGAGGFCVLYGSHEPFPPSKIAALYPTHSAYVTAVKKVSQQNQKDGFILKDDMDDIIHDAEVSLVGTTHPQPIP